MEIVFFDVDIREKLLVVKGVDFELEWGEIFGIVGEFGFGKFVIFLGIMGLVFKLGWVEFSSEIDFFV